MGSKRPTLAYTPRQEKKQPIRLRVDRYTPPAVGVQDEPYRCYRLNNAWAKILMGWMSMLTEIKGWDGATDERHPGIVGVETFLLGEDCMSFQLRQNPVIPCLIEQSADGGLSWSPAFDLSLCTSIVDGSSQITTVSNFYNTAFNTFQENVYNNYVNNYISSITDIVPELGYGDGDDSFRDEALCYALSKFIDIVCEAGIEAFDALDETADDLKTALYLAVAISGIIALAATGVGTPAAIALAAQAALWASGIGAATSLGATLFDHFTGTNRSAYEDLQAREDVVCCLLSTLEGVNVDRDDFENAFACTGLSVNAQATHDAAAIFATEDATYAAFVENMRIGFNSAKLGLLPSCPCDDVWLWRWADSSCNYNMPAGFTLAIDFGTCGNGPGELNGLWRHTSSGDAALIFRITPSTHTVTNLRLQATSNFTSGTVRDIRVQQGAYDQSFPLPGAWDDYNFPTGETGEITITLRHWGGSFNAVGVREIEVSW